MQGRLLLFVVLVLVSPCAILVSGFAIYPHLIIATIATKVVEQTSDFGLEPFARIFQDQRWTLVYPHLNGKRWRRVGLRVF